MRKLLNIKRAGALVRRFKKARVLVIGDLIVDHFIWGKVGRISPEAPVPVVEVTDESILLGGSANVAGNINSLGGVCAVVGVVGGDGNGRRLVKKLKAGGMATGGVVVDPRRPTTIKTRVIAHSQQVVRFDRESKKTLGPAVTKKVLSHIKKAVRSTDVVLISDYSKGLVTKDLVGEVVGLSRRLKKPVVVDPKVEHFDYYSGVTAITPNNREASLASAIEIADGRSLKRAGKALMDRVDCEALLITRGEHGMSLFENGSETHIPTVAREVFDVSGAGDTVIGVFALALASGASFKEAAVLANFAAGVVVGKVGTATVGPSELLEAVTEGLKKTCG
ncbi:MAG: D-glycero-beta-D-manno-heptose-7-phosphate kinase [Thermodesulfobacteriota bacterium]